MNRRLATLVVAVFGLWAPPARAQQQFDRRSREEPEIVVEAGGRFGACDVLRFTPDGKFLCAAGDDKVVRIWPHTADGLVTERHKVQTLRWRAWREQRGGIKAMDLSPDRKKVAVGGYGMKPSTVAVLDRGTGDTLAITWPVSRKGDANFNVVTALAFHPDGRVGFGTADGSLWMWDPTPLAQHDELGRTAAPPARVGKHTLPKNRIGKEPFNQSRLIWFPEASKLVSLAESGQVYECDVANPGADAPGQPPPGKELFNVNAAEPVDARVFRAERIDDGKWLAVASSDAKVLLCSADGKRTVRLDLGKDRFPRSLAWHQKSRRLAVGVGRALDPEVGPRFFAEGSDHIRVYRDPTAKDVPEPQVLKHTGRAEALAFHPVDARLAIAGGDADEITLRDIDKLDEKQPAGVRGAGRRPWAVNLSENGKVLGVQTAHAADALDPNAQGRGSWTRFDLSRLKVTLDEGQKWVGPRAEADGWKIVPSKTSQFEWFAQRTRDGKTERLLLALNRFRDQAPTCFTFLPATDKLPTRVLVGHYYGCTLFELVPERAKDGELPGTKIFTGHAGEVTSVVAAKNQEWFVTGGTDQTVAAWSLKDREGEPNLGSQFEEANGTLRVKTVDTGAPAWEAGLRVGDVIDLLAVDARIVYARAAGYPSQGTVAGALAALKKARPGIDHHFGVAAGPKVGRHETATTVRQRPLWKWFPAFDARDRMNDWVVWMWHGSYYHTKTANGDRLVGWHVNAPTPGGRPEFYQLQQFEKQFHRPEVLEQLSNTGDLGAALVAARGPNPTLEPFDKYEPAPVRVALGSLDVPKTGLPLHITVRARGTNPDLLPARVELWLNDFLMDAWPPAGQALDATKPFDEKYTIPAAAFRTGDNRLTVVALNAAGGRAEEAQLVTNPRPATGAKLFGVTAGVNDYSAARQKRPGARDFGDLKYAGDDATVLGAELRKYAGPKLLFKEAAVSEHRDPNRAKLAAELAALAARAEPDDTLVVFFAGHGDLVMPKDGPLPKGARALLPDEGALVLCCLGYSAPKAGETALAAEELFAALARINCRKVVLLDACHSGRVASTNVLRRCVPNGLGPLVIAACDEGQQSHEHPKYQHGLFTYAMVTALDKDKGYRKADFDTDGALSAEELFEYVSAELPVLLKRAGLTEPQTPVCFPRQLPKDPFLKR